MSKLRTFAVAAVLAGLVAGCFVETRHRPCRTDCWWDHGRRICGGLYCNFNARRDLDIGAAFCFSIGGDWKKPLAKTRLKCALVGTSKCIDVTLVPADK